MRWARKGDNPSSSAVAAAVAVAVAVADSRSGLSAPSPSPTRVIFDIFRNEQPTPVDYSTMNDPVPALHHEHLDAYKASIEFLSLSAIIVSACPKGHAAVTDQLRRAALSIPLNIAEGYGRRTIPDKRRFYDIARGSAHECGALLDASNSLGIIDQQQFVVGKQLLVRVVQMLVRLAQL